VFLIAAWCLLVPQDPLADLDSADPAVARRAFEAAILAGDEKALEAAAAKSVRAKLALAEVRAHKRFGDAYPPVRTVTVEFKEELFAEALDKFSKAAGVVIQPYSPSHGAKPAERITLRLNDSYVLEALDSFAQAAGITIYSLPEGYRYSGGSWNPKKSSYSRHMHLALRSVQEERSANAVGDSKVSAYLDFAGRSDGEIRIAGHGEYRFLEIWEKPGVSLMLESSPKRAMTGAWSASSSFATGSYIKTPSADCEVIPLIRGVLEILVPEKPVYGDVPLEGEAKELSGDNISFRLNEVNGGGLSVKVSCPIGNSQKPHVRPILADFQLKGADGALLDAKGAVTGAQNAPEASLSFAIPPGFKAAALRIRHFGAYGSLEIPFEYRDVKIR